MIKVTDIIDVKPYYLVCRFNNGEVKKLDMAPLLQQQQVSHPEVAKLWETNVFLHPNVGKFGQVYWPDVMRMKDEQGKWIACEYDLSPEFVYAQGGLI